MKEQKVGKQSCALRLALFEEQCRVRSGGPIVVRRSSVQKLLAMHESGRVMWGKWTCHVENVDV